MNHEGFKENNTDNNDETPNDNLEFSDSLNTPEKRAGWFAERKKYILALVAALGVYAVTDFSKKASKETEDKADDSSQLYELYTPEESAKLKVEEEARAKLNLEREAMPGKPYSEFWKPYPDDIKQRYMAVIEELTEKLGHGIDNDLMRAEYEGTRKRVTNKRIIKEDGVETMIGEEPLLGKSHTPPVLAGFEGKFPGLSGYIGKLWSDQGEFYPKGWINGEISEIKYSENDTKPGVHYGAKVASWKTRGSQERFSGQMILYEDPNVTGLPKYKIHEPPKDFVGPINTPFSVKLRIDALDYVFGHEVGHANDWFSDKDINIAERAELLFSIIKRLESEDRFKSPYVEAIEAEELPQGHSPEDLQKLKEVYKKQMTLTKAAEYWADICQQYFSDPENFKLRNQKDYDIVNNHVIKTDKDFDPIKKAINKVDYLYGSIPSKDFWDFPFSGERTRFPTSHQETNSGEAHNHKNRPVKKKK